MIRRLNDKHVKIIKQMLVDNFRTISIIDHMEYVYKVKVKSMEINAIRTGESYFDIRSDLNDKIAAKKIPTNAIDNELVRDIKLALVSGCKLTEIINKFNVSSAKLRHIRLCHAPYSSIASEHNNQLAMLWHRRKRTNIDEAMIISIKRDFVKSKGTVTGKDLAEKHNIDKSTVSTILSLKQYEGIGYSYNAKIISIKEKMEANKRNKKEKVLKAKAKKKKAKLMLLKAKQRQTKLEIMKLMAS